MISYNMVFKLKLDSSKSGDKSRRGDSRAPQEEGYSHLEWIQLFPVGGLLPLQTVCQLRADLRKRRSVNIINHHCILYSYVLYEEYSKSQISAPACSRRWFPTTSWPPARPSPALSVTPPSAARRGETLQSHAWQRSSCDDGEVLKILPSQLPPLSPSSPPL